MLRTSRRLAPTIITQRGRRYTGFPLVIDEQKRGQGMGKCLMDHCEQELKQRGVILFQTEASPNAYLFYKKLGYIDMPFNNPDGEATHPDDQAMGKYL